MVFAIGTLPSAYAQTAAGSTRPWTPVRLADGQPDIQGMWNNEEANFTPLELPKELAGRTTFTPEELQARAEALAKSRIDAGDATGPDDVGFYALYWFDWYWRKPLAGDWPALVVDPPDGRMPSLTPEARKTAAYMRDHLHDAAETMEAGDRCVSRGVLGMMMPTAYNNGKLIVQTPGHVVIYSEMIHNARIIPLDGRAHLNAKVDQVGGRPSRPLGREHARHRIDEFQSGQQSESAERSCQAKSEAAHGRATDDCRREHAEVLRHGRRS